MPGQAAASVSIECLFSFYFIPLCRNHLQFRILLSSLLPKLPKRYPQRLQQSKSFRLQPHTIPNNTDNASQIRIFTRQRLFVQHLASHLNMNTPNQNPSQKHSCNPHSHETTLKKYSHRPNLLRNNLKKQKISSHSLPYRLDTKIYIAQVATKENQRKNNRVSF